MSAPDQAAQLAQLKQQLADIHWPEPVSDWPPAPGWFILFAGLMMLVAIVVFLAYRHHRANAYRRAALAQMDQLSINDQSRAAVELSQLLRRCQLHLEPFADHSSQGAERHQQLARFCRRECPVSAADIQQLEALCYGRTKLEPDAFSELLARCRSWIQQHQRKPSVGGGQHA